jgi:hypothetical protein
MLWESARRSKVSRVRHAAEAVQNNEMRGVAKSMTLESLPLTAAYFLW